MRGLLALLLLSAVLLLVEATEPPRLCDSLADVAYHRQHTAEEAKPFAYRWKYVILAATGRSGSTTLLRYLNTVPGFHLTGENNNALFGLLRMRKTLLEIDTTDFVQLQRTQYLEPHTRKGPWYNTFEMAEVDRRINDLIQYLLSRRDCVAHTVGFKEIRIFTRDVDVRNESWTNLHTLMDIEPRTAVIFLTRDVNTVINSSWWQHDRRRAFAIVSRQHDLFTAFHEAFPDRTYMLDYVDVINYTPRLEGLFQFLGVPFVRERLEEINKVVFGSNW